MLLSSVFRRSPCILNQPLRNAIRELTAAPVTAAQLPPRPTINESDLEESFLRGSGPGGQKIVRRPKTYSIKDPPLHICSTEEP